MTQGIYRFDPALYGSLIDTPVSGDLPADTLYQLPEWCVYVETPESVSYAGQPVHGAFAWLEHDVNDGRGELRLLLDIDTDTGPDLYPCIIHLGGSVEDGIERARQEMRKLSGLDFSAVADAWIDPAQRIVSLLLYMCSVADYQRQGKDATPKNPSPKRTKRGTRLFAASAPATWDVGVRMGSALRAAYQAKQTAGDGTHAGPRGHIRRGHWHSYRHGPRKDADGQPIPTAKQALRLQWMPPIPVNLPDPDGMPATVRPVR